MTLGAAKRRNEPAIVPDLQEAVNLRAQAHKTLTGLASAIVHYNPAEPIQDAKTDRLILCKAFNKQLQKRPQDCYEVAYAATQALDHSRDLKHAEKQELREAIVLSLAYTANEEARKGCMEIFNYAQKKHGGVEEKLIALCKKQKVDFSVQDYLKKVRKRGVGKLKIEKPA
jgi:hypothetical protein